MTYQKEPRKGNTESLLNALLTCEPKDGYQLAKEIELRSLRITLMGVAASALIAVLYQTHPPFWSFRFDEVFAAFGIQLEAAPVALFNVGLAIVLTVAFLLSPFFLGVAGLGVMRRYRLFYHHRANPFTS
jgi:hypothetical protein